MSSLHLTPRVRGITKPAVCVMPDSYCMAGGVEIVLKSVLGAAGLEACKRIAAELADERPLVLFNPRLAR